MHFSGYALAPSFHGELSSVVVGMSRKTDEASKGGDIEDYSSTVSGMGAHVCDGASCHTCRSEKQRLHLQMSLLFSGALGVSRKGISGIVDDDVEMEGRSEMLCGGGESGVDGGHGCYIQSKFEDVGVVVGKVGEGG